jgi:hypothetical protein
MQKTLISVGELIDKSWEVYRARFTELLGISGWLLVTAILFAVALIVYPSASVLQASDILNGWEKFGVWLFSITTYVITPIFSFWIFISIARWSNSLLNGAAIETRVAMRDGAKYFLKTLLTTLMVVLMVMLALVIGFGPPVIIAALGAITNFSPLVMIANLLLIIGIFVALFLSIKWMVYYLFAPLLTILEEIRGKQALEYSRRLIEGRFWQVLGRTVVPKLVFVIFGVFAMSICAFIANFAIDVSQDLNIDLQARFVSMVETIIPIIITALINPLVIISDVILLRSMREQ